MEAALQPRSEQPEPPASPALLPSFTRKLQPQCPPPKGPPHLPLPEKGEPVLGSLTRGTLLCLELHSAAQRTERWLAEGGQHPLFLPRVWFWHGCPGMARSAELSCVFYTVPGCAVTGDRSAS